MIFWLNRCYNIKNIQALFSSWQFPLISFEIAVIASQNTIYWCWEHSLTALMSQSGDCIRPVFEQKVGLYKVCIFVNMGPFGKLDALRYPNPSKYSLKILQTCISWRVTPDTLKKTKHWSDYPGLRKPLWTVDNWLKSSVAVFQYFFDIF